MGRNSELGSLLDSASRNYDRNKRRFGPAALAGSAVIGPAVWVRGGDTFFTKVGRATVVGALVAGGIFGVRWGYSELTEQACKSDFFDAAASKAKGKPCHVPVMASLELLSEDEQHVVPDLITLELDTDTRALGEKGNSRRKLEVEVSGEATANYALTNLAANLLPDQVNSVALFGIYNNAINAGGAMGQRAKELCDDTVEAMLTTVRSNPSWFEVDGSFPASMIGDPNLVPHSSEGGITNFEISFVTHERPPVFEGATPTTPTTAAASQDTKRTLVCAEGPGQ